jgi:hypothetical protein
MPLKDYNQNIRKTFKMITAINPTQPPDKGNRRIGIERRQFSYTHYLPERREGNDRRREDGENTVSEKKK